MAVSDADIKAYVEAVMAQPGLTDAQKAANIQQAAAANGVSTAQIAAATGYPVATVTQYLSSATPAATVQAPASATVTSQAPAKPSDADVKAYVQSIFDTPNISRAEQASRIQQAAQQYGVTNAQLARATGYSLNEVMGFLGEAQGSAKPATAPTVTPTATTARPTTGNAGVDGIIGKFTDYLQQQLASDNVAGARQTYNLMQQMFGFTDAEMAPFAQQYNNGISADQIGAWKAIQDTARPVAPTTPATPTTPAPATPTTPAPTIDQSRYTARQSSGYGTLPEYHNLGNVALPPGQFQNQQAPAIGDYISQQASTVGGVRPGATQGVGANAIYDTNAYLQNAINGQRQATTPQPGGPL